MSGVGSTRAARRAGAVRWKLAAAGFLSVALTSGVGAAQQRPPRGSVERGPAPTDGAPQATVAYERGVAALDAQRFQEASEFFEESYRLRPRPNVLQNLALAYRGAGRYGAAIEATRRYLEERADRLLPGEAEQLRAEITRLEQARPLVRLLLVPAGARVSLDGQPLAEGTTELRVDPGARRFEVRAEGFTPQERSLELRSGSTHELRFELEALAQLGRLEVLPTPATAEVSLDGVRLGVGPLAREIAAGEHELALRNEGYLPLQRRVSLRREQLVRLELALTPLPEAAPAPRATARAPAANSGRPAWLVPALVVGGVLVAGGVASVAVAGVVGSTPGPYPAASWGVVEAPRP